MQRSTLPEPPGFADLPKADQIRYLQTLWDQIAEKPGELPVPEGHLELAEARLEGYRRDPTGARSAYEALDRLASRRR